MNSFSCPHCHKVFESELADVELILCPHCNSTVALPEKDLEPGTVMGGFEIMRLLGRGGMGNVYLAKQISMDRLVALKILLKSFIQDKESVEQFLNEARVSGRLNHPNIIPAIDAGEYENTYYLATAFVNGEDLEKKLEKEHTISEKEALGIIIKIAHALNYAWDTYGLLHKDIKPGNIMYDLKGEVYLMDMGIAQYIGEGSGGEEHILGSPFYMSPEQTTASRLNWTSDLYSLGATLYNMIVGVPPYDAPEVMRIIEMHTTEPFPLPTSKNPDIHISKPTVALMKIMMGKKPEDRYDSWLGFIEAATEALKKLETKAIAPKKKEAVRSKKLPTRKKSRIRSRAPKNIHVSAEQTKKADPAMVIMSWILMLIVAGTVAYIVLDYRKKNIAHEAIRKAERFVIDHRGDYDSIIGQFQQAKRKCKGMDLEKKVDRQLAKFKKEKKIQKQLIVNYHKAKKRVSVLFANKDYDQALKIIIAASRDIQDPSIQRDTEMTINLIRQSRDSEE